MTALTVAEATAVGTPRLDRAAAAGPRALRRLPIPVSEPRPALRVVPDRPAGVPPEQCALVLPGDAPGPGADGGADGALAVAPPPGAWARQFVQAALEVSSGRRPVSQLVRWTSEEVFAVLSRRHALAQRIERPVGTAAPMVAVRSVRLCRPADGVVEVAAVVVDRGRVRAVALRLEDLAGRWRVNALEIG